MTPDKAWREERRYKLAAIAFEKFVDAAANEVHGASRKWLMRDPKRAMATCVALADTLLETLDMTPEQVLASAKPPPRDTIDPIPNSEV